MYSTNGRTKTNIEVAEEKKVRKHTVVCKACGHKMPNKSIEFGEKSKCEKCDSLELMNRWE